MADLRIPPLRRLWMTREVPPVLDDHGFLVDLDAEPASWTAGVRPVYGRAGLPTEALRDWKCLVLLGAAGSGKTTCIGDGSVLAPESVPSTVVHKRLRDHLSDQTLHDDVFLDPRVTAAVKDGTPLTLVLDDLDEASSRIETLPTLIRRWLGNLPHDPGRRHSAGIGALSWGVVVIGARR